MARRSRSSSRLIGELNMTPLLDLTFLLLITFMITMPLVENGIPVRLPLGKASDLSDLPSRATVSLDAAGTPFLDDVQTTLDMLPKILSARIETEPDLTVLVRADESLPYGKVVALMNALHDAKISRVALVTSPKDRPATAP